MRRRQFLRAAAAMAMAPLRAATRPNIVLILADDLGYADLGFQGCRDIPTPNLDRLAAQGVRFTSGFVSHPFCSPTRAGIMTGRYQQRFGHENNPAYSRRDEIAGLPTSQTTIAQVLASAGYVTGHVGKWHLGAAPKFHPMRRGFREDFGFLGGGHDYFKQELEGDPREYLIPIERDGKPVPEPEYLTDALSREAAAFVRRHARDPFFLYLAYNTPHTPRQVTDGYLKPFSHIEDEKRRKYAAMVHSMDVGVGRVLGALDETGTAKNTLVVFLSDNGGPVGINGSTNTPLRAGKGTVYEGGIRVPFVMRWPDRLQAGTVFAHSAISLDLFPTFAAAAGARVPVGPGLDGVDLLPHLARNTAPHRRLFWRTGGGVSHAVREGRYKLVRINGRRELFDLDTDIAESTDLSASKPEIVSRLDSAITEWDRQLVPPLFQNPRPAGKKK